MPSEKRFRMGCLRRQTADAIEKVIGDFTLGTLECFLFCFCPSDGGGETEREPE